MARHGRTFDQRAHPLGPRALQAGPGDGAGTGRSARDWPSCREPPSTDRFRTACLRGPPPPPTGVPRQPSCRSTWPTRRGRRTCSSTRRWPCDGAVGRPAGRRSIGMDRWARVASSKPPTHPPGFVTRNMSSCIARRLTSRSSACGSRLKVIKRRSRVSRRAQTTPRGARQRHGRLPRRQAEPGLVLLSMREPSVSDVSVCGRIEQPRRHVAPRHSLSPRRRGSAEDAALQPYRPD